MSIRTLFYFLATLFGAAPMRTIAAEAPEDLKELIDNILDIFQGIIPLLMGVALIGFLWGVAKYIWQADNKEARAEGSKVMLYGIIALFVMLSIWGLVAILSNTFGVSSVVPQLGE